MINVAIDGPSGAGKSTIAKAVAKKKGFIYVDTGALYRSIGLYVSRKGIAKEDKESIISCLPEISLELKYVEGVQRVYLNSEDVSEAIRMPEISMYASAVSSVQEVRDFLLGIQRDMAKKYDVIMDGRDIGTVILPDATVKIFMTASNEGRAKRRYKELCEKGVETTYEEVLRDMTERDRADSTRAIAPAVPAEDAIMFDNTEYGIEECVDRIIDIIEEAAAKRG
ncbi:MAG: (d)CMP kinase [Ruminococcaceae bacterium]|nr:(d)CMP kinase [Oscillospiraceae bacterium]